MAEHETCSSCSQRLDAEDQLFEQAGTIERLRAALEEIASQGRPVEFDDEQKAIADYEGAYDLCVLTAREALRDD